MAFPLAQTIGHAIYTPGSTDSHGNAADAWADPVPVAVYGYGPPMRLEIAEPGGTQLIHSLQVFAPTFPVDNRDRFYIDGVMHLVVAEPSVWDDGMFGYEPGMMIRLKKVEGGL